MKGLVRKKSNIVLETGLPIPTPRGNEVLVKVSHASINPFDQETLDGQYDRMRKLNGGKNWPVQTGLEFSGTIEQDGKHFKKGERVFGYIKLLKTMGSHQEYFVIDENLIARMPSNLSFAEAAGVPLGALTTWVALREVTQVAPGKKVLINGAGGGLGIFAVQIAKNFGSHVTAVGGDGQEAFLKELGADTFINYKQQAIVDLDVQFDILFDLTARVKFGTIKHLLKPSGEFIPADPFFAGGPAMFLANAFRRKKSKWLMVRAGHREKLTQIATLIEQGKLKPVIDSVFPMADFALGFQRIAAPGKRGRIVMDIAGDN